MKIAARLWLVTFVTITNCSSPVVQESNLYPLVSKLDSIRGKTEFLNSPYVTAGDRVYMVGNQDGTFPDIGWHIDGEMGGIWDHPIKLMDGFSAGLQIMEAMIFIAWTMPDRLSTTRWQTCTTSIGKKKISE